MKDWKGYSYGRGKEPYMQQISYVQAQRIYNLYCERLTYSRARSAPLRRQLSLEEKLRYMETIYGREVAHAASTGRSMFKGMAVEHIDRYHQMKAEYEALREKVKPLEQSHSASWEREDILNIARGCGGEICGLTSYYDPYYKKDMAMLVFGIGMLEYNKLKVPSIESETVGFTKNIDIQNITHRIAEKIWDKGIFCEPVPCATYYHLDNMEFNQVRFCEAAFSGRIGKNFIFLTKEFGPKFRMGQVILHVPPQAKFSTPEVIDFCKNCNICVDQCPSKALALDDVIVCSRYFMTHEHCSKCLDVCPVGKDK